MDASDALHHPPARKLAVMRFDPIRGNTVLFGGADSMFGALADTWLWDGTDWTQMTTPVAPSPRFYTSMAWQPARGRLALVGGGNSIATMNDVWEWTGSEWHVLDAPPTPRGRVQPMLFAEHDGSGLVMLGGWAGAIALPIAESWLLRWQGSGTADTCVLPLDLDGDGLLGCQDPDCWYTCSPQCAPAPQQQSCVLGTFHCGDGTCSPGVESCGSCPADCGVCPPVCGDGRCDPGESCPGDCP